MSYLIPSEFVTKMVDAGESKIFMSTRDTLIRAYMAGAILLLAAVFAVSITVQTNSPIFGAILSSWFLYAVFARLRSFDWCVCIDAASLAR